MDYQGIGMITVFLILVSLLIWFMVSRMKNNPKDIKPEVENIKLN